MYTPNVKKHHSKSAAHSQDRLYSGIDLDKMSYSSDDNFGDIDFPPELQNVQGLSPTKAKNESGLDSNRKGKKEAKADRRKRQKMQELKKCSYAFKAVPRGVYTINEKGSIAPSSYYSKANTPDLRR